MALPIRPRPQNNDHEEGRNASVPTAIGLPPRPSAFPVRTAEPQPVEEETSDFGLPSFGNDEDSYADSADNTDDFLTSDNYYEEDYAEEEQPVSAFASDEELEADDSDTGNDDIDQALKELPEDVISSVDRLMLEIISDESSEVIMNGPANVHFKKNGVRYHMPDVNFRDPKIYHYVIDKFILDFTDTKERLSDSSFLIEGQLQIEDANDPTAPPTVARVHIIAPPAVKWAKVTIAKKAKHQFTLDDLMARGSMTPNMNEFLKAIARGKVTTVLSGLSGSGKTTLLEAMSHYFDQNDRIIVVEDTPELRFPVADVVYMVSTKPKPGDDHTVAAVTLEWLVQQTNRMRPDRIIVGETRGAEMSEFLIAANSGADGSMTTIHAQDPRKTLSKMNALAARAGDNQSEISINKDIASTVQIIVQTGLVDGKHVITHIEEISNTISQQTGAIATTNLFIYDRRTGTHRANGRPSDALKDFMAARGVEVKQGWFQN